MNTFGYLYQDNFNPFNLSENEIQTDDQSGGNNQFKLNADLQKRTKYILVVTTFDENEIGSFAITAFGPNDVTFKSMNSSSVFVQAKYASNLNTSSSKYSRDCIEPNYYYEAIEINVVNDSFYSLGGYGEIFFRGYLYKDKFNPFNPSENQINADDYDGCLFAFRLTAYLQKQTTYILVVTTPSSNQTGSFSTIALGINNITLKHTDVTQSTCFLSNRCNFYKRTIGLTLDDILRDHIQWNTTLNNQSLTLKISAAFTIIIFIGGLINGILCFITFQNKDLQNVGCGIYLLGSSITSLITLTMFTVKYFFLLISDMAVSMNVSVMLAGCKSIEPILKVFLYLDAWLNACVAVERGVTVSKGVRFNLAKSKRIALRLVIILPLCVIVSFIHEPIKRGVFEFKSDKNRELQNNEIPTHTRDNYIYCITRYSPLLEIYNTIILFFHLLVPFLINLFSALYIIFGAARQRSAAQPGRSYRQHVREQFKEHKQLVISPLVLVILSSPRVIIALLPACINVSQNAWLYLSAYFISFVPSMLVFIIFVLPSSLYKKKFKETIKTWQQRFCR